MDTYGLVQIILLIVGFFLLVKGADFLIDGAEALALKVGISPFIVGLTVVAVGTSAPEIAISIISGLTSSTDVLLGNLVGSNIINVALILAITSIICVIPVDKHTRHIELPFVIIISLIFLALGLIGGFKWYDGLILVIIYALFVVYAVISSKKEQANYEEFIIVKIIPTKDGKLTLKGKIDTLYENGMQKLWFLIVLIIFSLALIIGGAELVINSAKYIASNIFSISEKTISLTIVAFGTSLPELATSITAARRGNTELATGDIIGSNIANVLLVGGFGFLCSSGTTLVSTIDIIDILASVVVVIILLSFALLSKKKSLSIPFGITSLLALVAYYAYLFVR